MDRLSICSSDGAKAQAATWKCHSNRPHSTAWREEGNSTQSSRVFYGHDFLKHLCPDTAALYPLHKSLVNVLAVRLALTHPTSRRHVKVQWRPHKSVFTEDRLNWLAPCKVSTQGNGTGLRYRFTGICRLKWLLNLTASSLADLLW